MLECTAEELEANRTIMDNITEAIGKFTRAFAGINVDRETIANYTAMVNDDDQETDQEEN